MVSYSKELATIKELLEKNPQGMTITDISKALDIYRKTTAKYLDMLLITGQVEMRPFGPVKIYTPSRRVPVSSMLNLSGDYILVLDSEFTIVELNDLVLSTHGLERDNLIGKHIGTDLLPFGESKELIDRLQEALNGKEYQTEINRFPFSDLADILKLVPVTFDDGSKGLSLILVSETRKRLLEERVRKDEGLLRILSNLVFMTRKTEGLTTVMEQCLETIGNGFDANRVYISKNGLNEYGDPTFERVGEWVGQYIEGFIEDPGLQKVPYRKPGERLLETLSKGRMYFGHIHDFLEEERTFFEVQGIISIALVPVFVHGEWWGFLGWDKCLEEWDWSTGEMEALKASAGIMGFIIERSETEEIEG